MYAGHFATALVAHRAAPKIPPWILVFGVGLLDIINAVLTGIGVEKVIPNLQEELGFTLADIDWDHSLAMAVFWALLFALLGRRDQVYARVVALAVFSHFLLDLLVHDRDLALWPGSVAHVGLQGWHLHPLISWVGEFVYSGVCFVALHHAKVNGERLVPFFRSLGVAVLLVSLNVTFSPWWSPLRMAAALLSPEHAPMAYSVLVFIGFVVPAIVLTKLLRSPP